MFGEGAEWWRACVSSERHAGRITLELRRHGVDGDTDKSRFYEALLWLSRPLPGELTRKCHLNVSLTSSSEGRGRGRRRGFCWYTPDLKELRWASASSVLVARHRTWCPTARSSLRVGSADDLPRGIRPLVTDTPLFVQALRYVN